jgi:hypothetical protein
MNTCKKKNREGAVTLEACIVVTLFILFMLFLYSLFVVFLGHHSIGHAVLQSSESLSMDPYFSEQFTNSTDTPESVGDLLAIAANNIFKLNGASKYYSSNIKWYDTKHAESVEAVAKARFIAYFADGNEDDAKVLLDTYNVQNGLDGLDFSESRVEGGILYITVKYTMDYEFNFFNMAKQPVRQSAKAKLWK